MTHTSKIEKKALHDYGYQRLNSDETNFSNDPLWMISCILIISESKSRYVWKSREALYSLRHREDGRNYKIRKKWCFFYKRNKLEINQEGK